MDAVTDEHPAASAPAEPTATVEATRVRVRRVPRFGIFLVAGAIVGVIVALVLTAAFEVDPSVGFAATWGYFSLWGIAIGLVVGAFVALVLDRVLAARARELDAERVSVEPPAEIEPPAENEPPADAEPSTEPAPGASDPDAPRED